MDLVKLYELTVRYGRLEDPRGTKLKSYVKDTKKEYAKLKKQEKLFFDKESFRNPYADTRILYGRPQTEVNKVLVGIDIEVPEILLADRIRQDEGLDLVLSHHPEGAAYAGLHEVMYLHAFLLNKLGLSKEIVDEFVKERINEVARKISPANHSRPVDAARLLNLPFMCVHTPADNFVAKFLQTKLNAAKPKKVNDVVDILFKIPEYKDAAYNKAGPKIILGKPENKAGKIFVDMTGGTEGPKELFGRIHQAGVSSLVCMHLSEEHFLKAKPEHLNVIIAGHIASDTLGLNLLLDKIERHQKLDIIGCSGFKRIRRA